MGARHISAQMTSADNSFNRPDYKPHIPAGLTRPSVENAYAQLSAPPPNLPPRRHPTTALNQGVANGTSGAGPSSRPHRIQTNAASSADPMAGPSTVPNVASTMSSPNRFTHLPPLPGAPDFLPISEEPDNMSPTKFKRPRPGAEKEVVLRAKERVPIWSTHLLDPCLRNSLVKIPQQVTNITNIALSGLSSGPKESYDQTIGAPIDGLARAAKDWIVAPDGKFMSENGGIELGIGIVDSGAGGWGKDKGRRRARIEVTSKHGGIKVDVVSRLLDLCRIGLILRGLKSTRIDKSIYASTQSRAMCWCYCKP